MHETGLLSAVLPGGNDFGCGVVDGSYVQVALRERNLDVMRPEQLVYGGVKIVADWP